MLVERSRRQSPLYGTSSPFAAGTPGIGACTTGPSRRSLSHVPGAGRARHCRGETDPSVGPVELLKGGAGLKIEVTELSTTP